MNDKEGSTYFQVGNQRFISLKKIERNHSLKKEEYKEFKFIADFIASIGKTIKLIVDIGCGSEEKSMLLQEYLNSPDLVGYVQGSNWIMALAAVF